MSQALSEPDDLLNSIQQGDSLAEKQLVTRYWHHLKFVLERQSIDSQRVLDLCQDTFVLVIQKARNNEIHSDRSLGAFIRSVGINLLIESKRKDKRRATYDTDNFDYIPDALSSVEGTVSRQQLISLVVDTIEQFDIPRDRDILKWTYLEHRSKQDICAQLNITPAHYDRVIFRAKQRLRADLEAKLHIDLKSHTLSDYMLGVLLCMTFMHIDADKEKFVMLAGDSFATNHCACMDNDGGVSSSLVRKVTYET